VLLLRGRGHRAGSLRGADRFVGPDFSPTKVRKITQRFKITNRGGDNSDAESCTDFVRTVNEVSARSVRLASLPAVTPRQFHREPPALPEQVDGTAVLTERQPPPLNLP
jgi:hypothetical protein